MGFLDTLKNLFGGKKEEAAPEVNEAPQEEAPQEEAQEAPQEEASEEEQSQ